MEAENKQDPAPSPADEPEMTPREIALAALDELSGIRASLVSALQLVCSVPPFKGVIGVSEDGEIYQLPKGGK